MFVHELEKVLQEFPTIYEHLRAICPIDQVPKNLEELDFVIVNTE